MLNKFFKLLKKRWYLIVVLVVVIVGGIYNKNESSVKNSKEKVYHVKKQSIQDALTLSGEIDATEDVILRFQNSGRLAAVGVKEGDIVKKYQWVASLDQRELEKNLKKYLNSYMSTRWDFDQTKEDKDIKNIGGLTEDQRKEAIRVLDKAQFDLNSAVLDVELRDIALQYAHLYSPIEGVVVRVGSPYSGVNITPTQAEFEIVNPKTIYFSAKADQTDVVKLKNDMVGEIDLDAYPDSTFKGMVNSIAFIPKTGETGTVYGVKMSISEDDNVNYKYRLGMTGDANFVLSERVGVVAVPVTFIKTENGKKIVTVLKNGNKMKQEITTGDTFDSSVEVTSGLVEGDTIYDQT